MESSLKTFETFKPRRSELIGIIAYYYIHRAGRRAEEERFVYYPHYRNAITCYWDSFLDVNSKNGVVTPQKNLGLKTYFSLNYSERIQVRIIPPFSKLGIAFEPLGLQRFIRRKFNEVVHSSRIEFDEFDLEFSQIIQRILTSELTDPSHELDRYFADRLHNDPDPIVESSVRVLFSNEEFSSLEELAVQQGLTLRSLQRKFKDHLGCTPREYQKLIQFRNAVNTYQFAEEHTSFTELAHDHNYYDQPAFIKHFKKVTGKKPREFFSHLKQFGTEDTFWIEE